MADRATPREVWGARYIVMSCVLAVAGWAAAVAEAPGLAVAWLAIGGVGCAAACACAIHQWRLMSSLRIAAETDALTRLLNRRAFHRLLEAELGQRRRGDEGLTLALIDVDDFKAVNDRLGHLGGDMALERVSGVIRRDKRRVDIAARLGGDEFGLVLPGTGPMQALAVAERIRTKLAESFDKTAVKVTLSIGIAGAPWHAQTTEELFHAADEAMYVAKALGKDRSVIYSDIAVAALHEKDGPTLTEVPLPDGTGEELTHG